jgi:hypothetical protein
MGKALSLTLVTILSLSIFTYVDVFADGTVRVAGHRTSVDTAGVLHISGIVENASNNAVGFVHVTTYLFDENGKELPTHDTYALLRNIPSGYIAPFDIPITDKRVANSIASYTLSLEWKTAQPKEDKFTFTDINAFVWTHIDPNTKQLRNPHASDTNVHHDSHAHTEITALVKNTGDLATKTVKVITIWYDERGQYYSYNMQTIARQMMPSENSRFVIMTHPTMGYYSLIVESENYISMRTDNGEHMFRVHEANNDNRMLPGVDTMSIKDLLIRDAGDNIIDKIPVKSKPVLPHFKPASERSIYTIKDGGKEYQLQIKTYENQLIDVDYDRQTGTITVLTNGADVNAMIHAEIIIPNTFNEFLSGESFEAKLNGVFLRDGLFFVDPYSYEGKTAMHYIISTDDLQVLSKEMTEPHSQRLVFTVQSVASDKPVSVRVGEPIQMQSIVTNNIDKKQKFTYILQVKDSAGATVSLSWIDGYIVAKESINTLLSWTPAKEGTYTVQIFLWESLTYPSSMSSNFASSTIIVS